MINFFFILTSATHLKIFFLIQPCSRSCCVIGTFNW